MYSSRRHLTNCAKAVKKHNTPKKQRRKGAVMRLWIVRLMETMMSLDFSVCTFEHSEWVLVLDTWIFLLVGMEQGPQNREKTQHTKKPEAQRGVLQLWTRRIKETMMSLNLSVCTFEHAGCVLLVEI